MKENQSILCRRSRPILALFAATLAISACKVSNYRLMETDGDASFKKDNTVLLTSTRSQGAIGFCWAYTAMAFLESLHKLRTHQEVKLSPEALGFYHYIIWIKGEIANAKDDDGIRALADAIEKGDLDGADFKDDGTMGMLSLLRRYGVVPESAYSVKFRETDGKVTFTPRAPVDSSSTSKELGADELFHHELADNLRYFLSTKGIDYLRGMSEPDLIQQMMYSRYGVNFVHEPPQSFTYEGVNYTPQSFLHDFLQIDLDALVVKTVSVLPEVYTTSNAISTDLNTFYADANANLHAGIAMPFGTSVSINRIFGGAFTTEASNRPYMEKMKADLENKKKFVADYEAHHTVPPADVRDPGAYLYLETKDYVDHFDLQGWNNDGGHAMLLVGPVRSTIQSAGDNDRLILKNSWGISIFGQKDPGTLSSDGLFLIEQGYIKLSTQHQLIDYVTPKTPGVAPFLASANYQNQFVPGQGGSVPGGEIGSTYCDANGKCYPYCTNGSTTGDGFGWQPELGGPNGGSCRVPATDAQVNGQKTPGQWCDGDGKCYPYCTNGSTTGGGFGWQPELGGPNGGSCRVPGTDAQGSSSGATGVTSSSQWCDGGGKCYPYCTNSTNTGGGFGWQPELGGPNGGSCRIR